MLFNSFGFAVFFIVVFLLYSALGRWHKLQNRLLLLASCVFYAAWDWRFLGLIFVLITNDYICGLKIRGAKDERIKKYFLFLSILVNLSILGFFKYFNFFLGSFETLLGYFGLVIHGPALKIILPLGISFYTFKTMTYALDIYNEAMEPTRDYLDYALYVTFFPQLLAGPIARARELLPQVLSLRKLSVEGLHEGFFLIFWGLFQKVFVADNLAKIVNAVFDAPAPYNGAKVLLALYAFAFQIYCDFAGYSNMAIGIGKCLGFETPINFNLPYFATNPIDFWRRWHMTLSSWLRDYVYTPIVMSLRNLGLAGTGVAVMATFLICGLWHGAAWTFVLWGAYWGALILLYALLQPLLAKIPVPKNSLLAGAWFVVRVIFFFHLICLGWLLFRAGSMAQAGEMLKGMLFHWKIHQGLGLRMDLQYLASFTWFFTAYQMIQFMKKDESFIFRANWIVQSVLLAGILFSVVTFGAENAKEFIYFQF